jgi:hypothetical protein
MKTAFVATGIAFLVSALIVGYGALIDWLTP